MLCNRNIDGAFGAFDDDQGTISGDFSTIRVATYLVIVVWLVLLEMEGMSLVMTLLPLLVDSFPLLINLTTLEKIWMHLVLIHL